jgi:RNA polymerase sigma-70 factor (ECF subfamily)
MAKSAHTRSIERERFEDFFRAHYDRLFQYVARRSPSARVDDVVAGTFVVAWKKFAEVDNPSLPWLYRIASFEMKNSARFARRHSRDVDLDASLFLVAPEHESVDSGPVLEAIVKLSQADQEVLRLIHWEELTRDEVAMVLNLTVNATNVRYHRALARLEWLLMPSQTYPPSEGVHQ